jgi:fructose-specific phosphotransferase system IIC component
LLRIGRFLAAVMTQRARSSLLNVAGLEVSRGRSWAWASSALAGITTVVYVALVSAENNNPFWDVFPWVMLMLLGTGAALTAALARDLHVSRAFATAGAVVLAVIGLVSIFSIGIGLILAAVAAAMAATRSQPATT